MVMAGRSLLAVSGVRPAHGFRRSARNSVRAQRASAVSYAADPENLTFSNCFTAWGSKKEVIVTRFVQPNRLPGLSSTEAAIPFRRAYPIAFAFRRAGA